MTSCTTCRWIRGTGTLIPTCGFPLPSWLAQIAQALDSARGLDHVTPGGRPLVNEIKSDRPYTSCPTWEVKP